MENGYFVSVSGGDTVNHVFTNLDQRTRAAVAYYWTAREQQVARQAERGRADQGARGAVTGGYQMGGFSDLICDLLVGAGIDKSSIFQRKSLELPGFFRPTKEWDLLVVQEGQLVAALELKSQVGPSFGNNFNNRTEEAMWTAVDLWTAYREAAFNKSIRPWLGYLFLLEDCQQSQAPVRVVEPHFKVFPEFVGASYARRYELFCRKLVRERHYSAAGFLLSPRDAGTDGQYSQPAEDLTFQVFARSLVAHAGAYGGVDP